MSAKDAEVAIAAPMVGEGALKQGEGIVAMAAALSEMDKAARSIGVEPDEPLGILLGSLRGAMEQTTRIARDGEARLLQAIEAFRGAASEDRARMKKATEQCEAETRKLQATFGAMEAMTHSVVMQTISTMTDKLAISMRNRMVIVERWHNLSVLLRWGLVLAIVVVGSMGVGYVGRMYQDENARAVLAHCLSSLFADQQTGKLYCQFNGAQAPQ